MKMLSLSISVFTVTSVSVHFSQTKMIWPGVQCSVVFTDILITSYEKDLDGFEKYLVKSHLIPSAYSRHTRFGYSCLSLALPITKTKPTILYKNENQSNHLRLTDVHVSSSQHIQSLSIFPWIVYANMYDWVNNYVHERERESVCVHVRVCVCVCTHVCVHMCTHAWACVYDYCPSQCNMCVYIALCWPMPYKRFARLIKENVHLKFAMSISHLCVSGCHASVSFCLYLYVLMK